MENNNLAINRRDILFTLIVGEICAILISIILNNLIVENGIIIRFLPYIYFMPLIFPMICLVGFFLAYLLGKIMPIIYQLAKFVLVGGLNFLIDMGVLNLLIVSTHISSGLGQSLFKLASFLVAATNSYFWNKYWTFKRESQESISQEFFQFLVISSIGLSLNLIVDYLLVNNVGPKAGLGPQTWAQASAVFSAILAMAWNFIGYKFIVFENKK